jgi:serine protease Do
VNNEPVKSVNELVKALNGAKGGGVMLEGIYEDVPGEYFYAFGLAPLHP